MKINTILRSTDDYLKSRLSRALNEMQTVHFESMRIRDQSIKQMFPTSFPKVSAIYEITFPSSSLFARDARCNTNTSFMVDWEF